MNITQILLTTLCLLGSSLSWSQHTDKHQDDTTTAIGLSSPQALENTSCQNIIDVKVNGLVCDFCARALEKVFSKKDEVAGIDVDLNNGSVSIVMNPDTTLDDKILEQLITDSGYNVVAINKGC